MLFLGGGHLSFGVLNSFDICNNNLLYDSRYDSAMPLTCRDAFATCGRSSFSYAKKAARIGSRPQPTARGSKHSWKSLEIGPHVFIWMTEPLISLSFHQFPANPLAEIIFGRTNLSLCASHADPFLALICLSGCVLPNWKHGTAQNHPKVMNERVHLHDTLNSIPPLYFCMMLQVLPASQSIWYRSEWFLQFWAAKIPSSRLLSPSGCLPWRLVCAIMKVQCWF